MTKTEFGIMFRRISNTLEAQANRDLRKDGLTLTQVITLEEIYHAPGKRLELKQLERILQVAQPTATGIVRRLEEKGLVKSGGVTSDRRIKVVELTPLGISQYEKAGVYMDRAEAGIISRLTVEEQEVLHILLQKVRSAIEFPQTGDESDDKTKTDLG